MENKIYMMDNYKGLIERLYKHHNDYGEGRTQNFFGVCLDCKKAADALAVLMEENAKLKVKAGELEAKNHEYLIRGGKQADELFLARKKNAKLRDELQQVKRERDAAVSCIYEIEDDPDRGNDNDWAREHIEEWRSPQKEG